MTHPRTPLPPSSATQVAIQSLAAQGQYGIVTDLARIHGIRRQQVYEIRERGREALEESFTPTPTEAPGSFQRVVTPADIERAVVALRVITPASIRDIVAVLPELYGTRWSYGKVWNVVNEAERRAAGFLESVDLSGVKSVALDEMFSQGRPVLSGIDLDTQYLFQLEVQDGRSGETWAKALGEIRDRQGLNPLRVVKDAGTGLASGVRECWPGIEEWDDLFHAVRMMSQEAYHLERRAYAAIALVDDLENRRARAQTETNRRSYGQQIRQARARMGNDIDRYDHFEQLRRDVTRVLDLTDRGSGRLRTSDEVRETLARKAAEMKAIGGKRVRSVARYIANRAAGLGRYLDTLCVRLQAIAQDAGGPEVVEATLRAFQASLDTSRGGPLWDHRARKHEMVDATRNLLEVTGHDPERLLHAVTAVLPILAHRHRASSAIENLNSVLRPYLVVQKHAEQGFLDLFRFYWNSRTRQWGPFKGTSAHEMLTGEKVGDWLTLLGFPPGKALAAAA